MSPKGSMIQGVLVSVVIVWVLMIVLVDEYRGDTAAIVTAWASVVIGVIAIIAWGLATEDDGSW